MDKPQLTDIDLYCIARMLQSSFQAPEQEDIDNTYRPLYGCMYCKYAFECHKPGEIKPNFNKVFEKLETMTGVSIGTFRPELDPEEIGSVFFPGSYYIEHPEILHELEKIHPKEMMDGFRVSLDKVITRSKETPG